MLELLVTHKYLQPVTRACELMLLYFRGSHPKNVLSLTVILWERNVGKRLRREQSIDEMWEGVNMTCMCTCVVWKQPHTSVVLCLSIMRSTVTVCYSRAGLCYQSAVHLFTIPHLFTLLHYKPKIQLNPWRQKGKALFFFRWPNEIMSWNSCSNICHLIESRCMSKKTQAEESSCLLTSIQRINVPQQILLFYFCQCLHYALLVIRADT